MKKAAAVAAGTLALVATTAPVFAQGRTFPDVPPEQWAAQAVQLLSDKGIVIGYPDGTYQGPRAMSRYEFAMAISRLLPLITKEINDAIANIHMPPPGGGNNGYSRDEIDQKLRGFVTPEQLQAAIAGLPHTNPPPNVDLSNYYQKNEVDAKIAGLRNEIGTVEAALDGMRNELRAMHVDVDRLKAEYAQLDARVSELEKLRVGGEAMASATVSAQYFGVPRGQYSAGVDENGALLDNGTEPGTGSPPNGNASAKHGLFTNPSALYDTQLDVQYSPDRRMRAVASFIMGNYYGAWQEQQAFNAAFPNARSGESPLLTNRAPGSLGLQTYLAYLAFPLDLPGAGSVSSNGIAVGRIPTQMTQYTWYAVTPDTYVTVDREASGKIPLTGALLSGGYNNWTYSVWGGYDPTDGTVPETFYNDGVDPGRNGLIGWGHTTRPGGNYGVFGALDYPGTGVGSEASRTHLDPNFWQIPSVRTAAGAHIGTPWLGFNYVVGIGDDFNNPNEGQVTTLGLFAPTYNRTGQAYSADFNTSLPLNRLTPFMPALGLSGEVAFSKTNNAGAVGVQQSGTFTSLTTGITQHITSTQGHAIDYKLTFPIGFTRWGLGGKSISEEYNAPGSWGQIGSWVNPWNYVTDSPIMLKTGKAFDGNGDGKYSPDYEVPIIPTEISINAPFHNVPLVGDLGLSLTDSVGHMNSAIGDNTPISPTMAAVPTSPQLFRITHAEGALAFGAGKNSGYNFGVSTESVLRDYPASGTFSRDATFLFDALKSLVNVRGGSGAHQPGFTAPTSVVGLGQEIQSDENYYKVSVGKNLTTDGSAFAKFTLSRIVYTDRTGNGGGSYRGAVGTMQFGWHF